LADRLPDLRGGRALGVGFLVFCGFVAQITQNRCQGVPLAPLDHLRDQAARKRKLWALQALISRIWPSFFLCCWLGAHKQHIRRVFFRHDIRGGWAALAARHPDVLAVGRGPLLHHTATPRSMIAPWQHQWQHLRPLHALAQASGRSLAQKVLLSTCGR
jgi:hypothetical protein